MKTIKIHDNLQYKTSELFAKVKEKYGKGWSYLSDKQLDEQFPIPKEPTTREFLDEVEPDTATRGLSYNDCEEKGLLDSMMTIREYLLMQLQRDTHSDVTSWTLFPVLASGGNAVGGGWRGVGGSGLGWSFRDCRDDASGPRVAVSLNPQSFNPYEVEEVTLGKSDTENRELEKAIKLVVDNGYIISKK